MLSSIIFTTLAVSLSLTFENATPASARPLRGRDPNSYIVKLKKGANTTSHINSLPFLFSVEDENSPINRWWPDDFFKGYSGIFDAAALDAIKASPDVEYVVKNGIVKAADVQSNAPWNLQAISTQKPVGGTNVNTLTYTYLYTQPIGAGVDIYIIDSGVYTDHSEFEERAHFGWSAWPFEDDDDDGHGTQVAGVAAGLTYGVAKRANIIAVKVLDENGDGSFDDTISGLNWVATNFRITGRPSIACLAFGSEHHLGLNDAAQDLVAHGVTVVTAAGNEAVDASTTSPASVEEVITVGASDILNAMAPFSNFGKFVDIFAPGVDITSAWINGPRSIKTDSGTSLAAAHIAGVAAYFLSMDTTLDPAAIRTKIDTLSTKNAISGVPDGTVDNFVYNGNF